MRNRHPGLFERPPGSNRWSIRYRDEFGRQHTEAAGTKQQATALLTRRKGEVQASKLEARSKRLTAQELNRARERDALTIKSLVERYQGEFERLKSYRVIDIYLKEWVKMFGDRHPAMITSGDVISWRNMSLATGRSKSTTNRYVAYLGAIYAKAIRDELLTVNPCARGRVPNFTEKGRRERVITPEEEVALLKELSFQDRCIFILCLHTGMRQGEALNLKRHLIDLEGGTIILPDTKAGKEQTVYLNAAATEALRLALSVHNSEWVFPNHRGTNHIAGKHVTVRLQKAASKLDLPKLWFHSLRHTYVTRLGSTTDIGTTQELARHSTVEQTRHYWHPSESLKHKAVNDLASDYTGWESLKKGHLRAVK